MKKAGVANRDNRLKKRVLEKHSQKRWLKLRILVLTALSSAVVARLTNCVVYQLQFRPGMLDDRTDSRSQDHLSLLNSNRCNSRSRHAQGNCSSRAHIDLSSPASGLFLLNLN